MRSSERKYETFGLEKTANTVRLNRICKNDVSAVLKQCKMTKNRSSKLCISKLGDFWLMKGSSVVLLLKLNQLKTCLFFLKTMKSRHFWDARLRACRRDSSFKPTYFHLTVALQLKSGDHERLQYFSPKWSGGLTSPSLERATLAAWQKHDGGMTSVAEFHLKTWSSALEQSTRHWWFSCMSACCWECEETFMTWFHL